MPSFAAPAGPGPSLPRLIAHRGASRAAPENTLAAIRAAAKVGARAVEVDVSVLGDGTAVLLHDPTLDRTTTGAGPLDAIGREALGRLDAGRWFGPSFAGEPVPTLEATLDLLKASGLAANLEMKPHGADPAPLAVALAGALAARPSAAERIVVSSFDPRALAALRALEPRVPRAMLWGAVPQDWAEVVAGLGAVAVHADWTALNRATAQAIRASGAALRVYTANDPDAFAPLRDVLDGVFTDDVTLFLRDPAWAAWAEGA